MKKCQAFKVLEVPLAWDPHKFLLYIAAMKLDVVMSQCLSKLKLQAHSFATHYYSICEAELESP